jgi:hypothetical protein
MSARFRVSDCGESAREDLFLLLCCARVSLCCARVSPLLCAGLSFAVRGSLLCCARVSRPRTQCLPVSVSLDAALDSPKVSGTVVPLIAHAATCDPASGEVR